MSAYKRMEGKKITWQISMRGWGWKRAADRAEKKLRKSKVTPWNAHVSSHLSLYRSLLLSLSLSLFLSLALSLAPFPSLSLSSPSPALALCLFLELPVGNVNRDFTAHCRCISRAHISPTCDLHQRRGSWGIFHASEGREWRWWVWNRVEGRWSLYPGAWRSKAL